MLPVIPQASVYLTPVVYVIGVVTIIYASFSTLRTIDIKELIAYSSVSHAAVYLMGVFSNSIQGIEGGIVLGLAHGFVSPALFICAGGVLYDRTHTRLITYYRGVAQAMPIFSILLFVLCLANAGTPLTLNFIGEFMSLYGTFERVPLLGIFASSSIILSAAYTIYMFNRIAFGGSYSRLINRLTGDLRDGEYSRKENRNHISTYNRYESESTHTEIDLGDGTRYELEYHEEQYHGEEQHHGQYRYEEVYYDEGETRDEI